jgi:DNA polymerase epsilon subunit 1
VAMLDRASRAAATEAAEGELDSAAPVDAVSWTVEYVRDDELAGAAVSKHLTAYLEDPKVRECEMTA